MDVGLLLACGFGRGRALDFIGLAAAVIAAVVAKTRIAVTAASMPSCFWQFVSAATLARCFLAAILTASVARNAIEVVIFACCIWGWGSYFFSLMPMLLQHVKVLLEIGTSFSSCFQHIFTTATVERFFSIAILVALSSHCTAVWHVNEQDWIVLSAVFTLFTFTGGTAQLPDFMKVCVGFANFHSKFYNVFTKRYLGLWAWKLPTIVSTILVLGDVWVEFHDRFTEL